MVPLSQLGCFVSDKVVGDNFYDLQYMNSNENNENFERQALTEHLRELRSCLVVASIAVFIGFCLSYTVIRPIGTWFFKPLTEVLPEGTSLIFTSYQEGFFFI